MLKKIGLVLIAALALTFVFSGVAYANFGPHGGYSADTDACAGCHRAHTSFSDVTWTDSTSLPTTHSALLIGSATTMEEFCNQCHGDAAPGASTNVVDGVFDSGPSGALGVADGTTVGAGAEAAVIQYSTQSSFDATLNGGGFLRMPSGTAGGPNTYTFSTSAHDMGLTSAYLWGDGDAVPTVAGITCTGCHDPHGSSNYRLLKDEVNGNAVGGYDASDNPQPYVESAEVGYPVNVGWYKHEAGAAQMAAYQPNYTKPLYYNNGQGRENISGWCAGCHERYIVRNDAFAVSSWNPPYGFADQEYDYAGTIESATGLVGTDLPEQQFHRHPMNTTLAGGDPTNPNAWLNAAVVTSTVLPLEYNGPAGTSLTTFQGDPSAVGQGSTYDDYLGCLTCHRAHGTSAVMTGWAEASLDTTNGTDWYPVMDPGKGGVSPLDDSALLRADSRGVCERCHNK